MLAKLKQQTRKAHEDAEEKSLAHKIINNTISVEEYKNFLLKQYQFYFTIESFLTTYKKVFPDSLQPFITNKKSKTLALDLENNFNYNLSDLKPEKIDITPEFSALLGMLYVIEGSMMGSMLIQKQLPNCNSLQHINQHYFFNLNPKEQVNYWKDFCKKVENISFTEQQINKAIHSANYTFGLVSF